MEIPRSLCTAMEKYVYKKTQIVRSRNLLRKEEAEILEELVAVFNLFDVESASTNSEVKTCDADPLQKVWRGTAFHKRVDITELIKKSECHRSDDNLESTET